jgi:DNA primase
MDDRFIEDLKNRVDIVDIARKYMELKKSGKNFMGRSPFRNERTPSFCVSPDKQFWYDFGASEGGDVISFLERIENIDFPEAVEILADMVGVEVPKSKAKTGPTKEQKKDIYALHAKAVEYFTDQLNKNKKAKDYLANRNISDSVISDWSLGYGGDSVDGLTKFLLQAGFSRADIAQSGVAFEVEFGAQTMKDRFAKRVMIPVHDARGDIIAFTGREIYGEKVAKYINSPENPVYRKSSTLFGLYQARKAIREQDFALLVEGNFDVISAQNAGFINTVATCGTSLTEDHLRILKRSTQNIYLAFDSDIAGKKATLKAVEMCLMMELSPFIVDIVGAKDLDELAQENPGELKKVVQNAHNALIFLLEKFSLKFLNGAIEGEKKFLDSFFYFVRLVPRPIEVDDLLTKISTKLNRHKSLIEDEFQKYCQNNKRIVKEKVDETQSQRFTREQSFVGFLSAHWDVFGPKLNEKILELFHDQAAEILSKKIREQPLSVDEQKVLISWELHQEMLYGDRNDPETLGRDFQVFVTKLKEEMIKKQRLQDAQKLRKDL